MRTTQPNKVTPLFWAVEKGDIDTVRLLLTKETINKEAVFRESQTVRTPSLSLPVQAAFAAAVRAGLGAADRRCTAAACLDARCSVAYAPGCGRRWL